MSSETQVLIPDELPVTLAQSAQGRQSGKAWKDQKSATRRSHMPDGVKSKSFEDRMDKTKRAQAVRKLEAELKEDKQAEIRRRREVTLERKKAAEERERIEVEKAKMGARKAARMQRKAGRTKKINQ